MRLGSRYSNFYRLLPFGSIARRDGTMYRYDYQGAYAEKDNITNWNNFELRMYDSRIGRWLGPDPAGQFASPYEGMGNNPVNGFDPTGGFDWYKDKDGNLQWNENVLSQDDLDHFGRYFEGATYLGKMVQVNYTDGREYFGDDHGSISTLLNEVKIVDTYNGPSDKVNSIGAGFSFGGGFGFEIGRIEDSKGDSRWFWSSSANIGYGVGIGYNHKEVWSNRSDRKFSVADYEGKGESLSGRLGPFSGSTGGDVKNGQWETNSLNKVVHGYNYHETTTSSSLHPGDFRSLLHAKASASVMWSFSNTHFF